MTLTHCATKSLSKNQTQLLLYSKFNWNSFPSKCINDQLSRFYHWYDSFFRLTIASQTREVEIVPTKVKGRTKLSVLRKHEHNFDAYLSDLNLRLSQWLRNNWKLTLRRIYCLLANNEPTLQNWFSVWLQNHQTNFKPRRIPGSALARPDGRPAVWFSSKWALHSTPWYPPYNPFFEQMFRLSIQFSYIWKSRKKRRFL